MTKPKILIVDDEPYNVDYLEQELEDLDYDIVSAANGQQALELLRGQCPDLVLLDIMMPVMDGFEVLARLQADPATRDLPVIIISAMSDLQSVVRGIQLGADDYLPKPFEPTLLRARIASSLEKKHLRDVQKLYLKSLEREMDIAREIQRGFLPPELPQAHPWEIAAFFRAARDVAGDFYDAFMLPDGSMVCVVGDVCGKGVGAALFMTLFRSLIRATATTDLAPGQAGQLELPPAERLQHVITFTNRYVALTHGEANMFAAVFIAILEAATGRLTYANCGNEAPLLLRQGRVVAALRPTGPVIGVIPEAGFAVAEIELQPQDLLLAFTDGIPDALDSAGHDFGRERLAALLEGGPAASAPLLAAIEAGLAAFTGGAEQFDDITLLAVRRTA